MTETSARTVPQPRIVLVEPQMGENIGAAARGMWNFGLEDMAVVAPRDGWPSDPAIAMAAGATHVLENAHLCETTREAVASCTHVYATTARPRGMTKRVVTPRQAAMEMRERAQRGERVGVLFGRERSGLGTEDIVLSNTIITAPVNPAFASLNLAQCVLLVGYEWMLAADDTPPVTDDPGKGGMAQREQVEALLDFVEGELADTGFFWPEEKAPTMKAALRNLYHRAPLTGADVGILWGTFRALIGKRRSGGERNTPRS